MRFIRNNKLRLAVISAAAFGVLALAAVALANVTIYSNTFSNKSQYRQVTPSGTNNACDRSFRKTAKKIRIVVETGDRLCQLRPPVVADSDRPDQDVQVDGKLIKSETPKSQRKGAFLSLAIRFGPKQSYQLMVKPKSKKYFLTRSPDGPGFPVEGTLNRIRPLDEPNNLRLRAVKNKIRAYINNKKVASKTDNSSGDVTGRRVAFGIGNTRPGKKKVAGLMDNLRVQVPNP